MSKGFEKWYDKNAVKFKKNGFWLGHGGVGIIFMLIGIIIPFFPLIGLLYINDYYDKKKKIYNYENKIVKEQSLTLFKATLYYKIPAIVIILLIQTYFNIVEPNSSSVLNVILSLIAVIMYIFTFIKVFNYEKIGYYLLIVTIIIETITLATAVKYNLNVLLIMLLLYSTIWALPNLLYFKSIKNIFIK